MQYTNPILPGFYPDPSICRVGKDYYLVTSSFTYFPGIPIFHSRDLVNWEQVGHCLAEDNFPDLTGVEESGGVWAPTIRFDEASSRFYVAVTVKMPGANRYHNLILHADAPQGPWSVPVEVQVGGIDPSLLFDEGKAWYCTNDWNLFGHPAVVLGTVDPVTGKTLEAFREIWRGTGEGWLEAPHIYRIGGWYYLLCAEGGTSHGHMASIARARQITGPYEACPHNPILTSRNDTTKQTSCCGHGDLCCDTDGSWWMVHLGCRPTQLEVSSLGRETFLTPVTWADGWPLLRDGHARILEEGPLAAAQEAPAAFSDDFSGEDWPLPWCFLRDKENGVFQRGNGKLSICPQAGDPKELSVESFACVRQPDLCFRAEAELEAPAEEGSAIGLMAYQAWNQFFFFALRRRKGKTELFLQRKMDDLDVETYRQELPVSPREGVRLRIEADRECYHFYCPGLRRQDNPLPDTCGMLSSAEEDDRTPCATASARFLSAGLANRGFTGAMVGLFARAGQEGAKPLTVHHFSVTTLSFLL